MSRVVVITGGSSGVGAAGARALRALGNEVAITGRSPATAELARELGCRHYVADFARFRDVRAVAAAILADHPRIDVLVNNAGAIIGKRQVTEDGHEKTLQVNHLSPFLLTMLLRRRLEECRGLVINTASRAHRWGKIDFADMESARRYRAWKTYGTTKMMNILHADEINRRFDGVTGVSFHPGVVATGFAREGGAAERFLYQTFLAQALLITPEEGADTLVWLATTTPGADWKPGDFYDRRRRASKLRQAGEAEVARELWEWSERELGIEN